jgi:DNA modification methylase
MFGGWGMKYVRKEVIGDCTLYQADCMDILPHLEKVDAVVTDPPYGLGKKLSGHGKSESWNEQLKKLQEWDFVPDQSVFDEILKISQKQIIWGGNYFNLPPSRMFLVWDKGGSMHGRSFAECEMAWCSWCASPRIKKLTPPTHSGKEVKEHPTQKPLDIMRWCLGFLPDAQTILDPFLGSGTSGVACVRMGRKFIGIELDPQYFEIACQRIQKEVNAPRIALDEPVIQPKQEALI